MDRSEYDFNKIAKVLEGIKKRLDRNSGVKAELIYKSKDLDKVLFAGFIHENISVSSISGDKYINETLAYYLENEGLVKMTASKDGTSFILTAKGYTFKNYGGFTALEKEEERRRQKEKISRRLWEFSGWIFAAIAGLADKIFNLIRELL